ncbi:hypothetical protein [Flavobacterium selenitireducens]|uniref:hypothetical protein n=1 Tax=Flavobacterium selenitireducens TaxID=2722704 RepID=UPI00168AFE7B|nr:hypothetical protein [Flavobacterium selenitireducens]MBD3583315.1 hypothetical protein [Flavobacterium selenitireducens]
MNKLLSLILTGIAAFSHAQQTAVAPIASQSSSIAKYFEADREGMHLHFNKAAYLAGERIWLKGYVVKKQTHLPYGETTNAYVSLLDAKGQKVAGALLYCENAVFSGFINTPQNLPAGLYYLQSYTNFMNNFAEDESSLYPITVINAKSREFYVPNAIDYASLDISFAPESGVFLYGTSNTVAFRIADCNGNGLTGIEAKVKNARGLEIASATTDAAGYSRFEVADTDMGPYVLSATIKGKEYQKTLPTPSVSGVTFSINNYIFPDKATVTVKTNKATLEQIKGKPFDLVIQSYGASTTAKLSFDGSQARQVLSIPSNHFSDGLNTVYLIDANQNKIGERMVYQAYRKATEETQLRVSQKRGDSIVVQGGGGLKLASLSISVVPVSSVKSQEDIYTRLELATLPGSAKISGRNYFVGFNRKKHYELDNMLITQVQKYDWTKITGIAPQIRYEFDKGLSIKGGLNNKSVDRANSKINLNAMAFGLNEFAELNEKNEFQFQNIIAEDSAQVYISLFNKKNERSPLQVASHLSGNNRPFIKPFEPLEKNCLLKPVELGFGIPDMKNSIRLDSVTVRTARKPKLSEQNTRFYANNMAKGFKITPQDVSMFSTIVDFIQNNGFNVSQVGGRVIISRTYSTSFEAQNSPVIFVDDVLQDDHNLLTTYRMDMIDEVYINKRGYGAGSSGANGIIRIYTKKGHFNNSTKILSKALLIKGGFQKATEYENPQYADYHNDAFHTMGAIHWIPDVATDSSGNFRFSFPNFQQDAVKVIIEGIASDGTLISEERTIETK